MTQIHTLTRHRDIQNWVTDRHGIPAIARVRNSFGEEHAQLKLSFQKRAKRQIESQDDGMSPKRAKRQIESQDDGMSPCSWTAWLAELDRQQLALKVDLAADDFELVDRRQAN
jgi:hypothetical protein